MLSNADFYFNYLSIIRFVLLNKANKISSPFELATINKVNLFFSVKDTMVLDNPEYYNFFYFFKFFFGKLAFIVKWKRKHISGNILYDYRINLILSKKDTFYLISFLVNDVFIRLNKDSFFVQDAFFKFNFNFLLLSILDTSVFGELKLNTGLHDLVTPLNMQFFFEGGDIVSSRLLINNLKLKFISL